MTEITLENETTLREADLNNLLLMVKEQLELRSSLWVNKLGDLSTKLENIVKTFKERKFKNFKEVNSFVTGDNTTIISFMNSAV